MEQTFNKGVKKTANVWFQMFGYKITIVFMIRSTITMQHAVGITSMIDWQGWPTICIKTNVTISSMYFHHDLNSCFLIKMILDMWHGWGTMVGWVARPQFLLSTCVSECPNIIRMWDKLFADQDDMRHEGSWVWSVVGQPQDCPFYFCPLPTLLTHTTHLTTVRRHFLKHHCSALPLIACSLSPMHFLFLLVLSVLFRTLSLWYFLVHLDIFWFIWTAGYISDAQWGAGVRKVVAEPDDASITASPALTFFGQLHIFSGSFGSTIIQGSSKYKTNEKNKWKEPQTITARTKRFVTYF